MKVILYLHGFCSVGNNEKFQLLKEQFPQYLVISPTLDPNPAIAIEQINDICEANKFNISFVIGTSLGGLYAHYVHCTWGYRTVLLNPVTSGAQMMYHVGKNMNHYTKETFIVDADYINVLRMICYDIQYAGSDNTQNCLVYLSTNDELINIEDSKLHFKYYPIKFIDDNHRMITKLPEVINDIKRVFSIE